MDNRYEKGLWRYFYRCIWYSICVWIINSLTLVHGLPKAILRNKNKLAVWGEPRSRRAITPIFIQTQHQTGQRLPYCQPSTQKGNTIDQARELRDLMVIDKARHRNYKISIKSWLIMVITWSLSLYALYHLGDKYVLLLSRPLVGRVVFGCAAKREHYLAGAAQLFVCVVIIVPKRHTHAA